MKYDYQLHLEVENNSHTQIIRRVPAEASVLELGCATGYMSAWLKQELGCRVVGVELNTAAAAQAASYCDRVIQANVEELAWMERLQGERFDIVTCADILEHLRDPEALLRRLVGCLKPEGRLLASIPNGAHASLRLELLEGRFTYEETGLLDRTHLHLFTHQSVRAIFGRAGYRVGELSYTFHDLADDVIRERLGRVGLVATDRALALLHAPEAAAYQFIVSAHPRREGEPKEVEAELTDKPLQDSLDVFSRLHDELHSTQVLAHEREQEKGRLQRDNLALHQQNQALEELNGRLQQELQALQQELQALQQTLEEQRARVSRLVGQGRQRQEELSRLEQELEQTRRLSEARHQELERQGAWRQELLASASWRLSAPLRWAGRGARALLQLLQFLALLLWTPAEASDRLRLVGRALRHIGPGAAKRMLQNTLAGIELTEEHLLLLEPLTPAVRRSLREQVGTLPGQPLISVLLPTYNTPAKLLEQALDSVLDQLYPAWELCIVDDGSSRPEVRQVLERYRRRDDRIRVRYSEQNQGISRASNQALALATGEYVALMDHDDLLQPHALLRMARSILAGAPDLLYSDEALFAENRSCILQYLLRPAFSLERLRSHPYIVHLTLFRTSLLREIGGFDPDLSISQDYDLILRAGERSHSISHVPEVLYMWRERSSSAGFQQQDSVTGSSRSVIESHLQRSGLEARVSPGPVFNFYRIDYRLPAEHRVAVIIPTRNHWQLVRQCVESLHHTLADAAWDLVLVDHASDEPDSLDYFRELEQRHRVIRVGGAFNFSRINNQAVAALGQAYSHYLFCNNDIEAIESGWLEHMLGFTLEPDVGMVGARLLYPDRKSVQHAGVCVGMHGAAEHFGKFMPVELPDGSPHPGYLGSLICDLEVSAVTAACMLVTREAFAAAGGFDEALAVGFGDVDLCLKVRSQGYRVIQANNAVLLHHESYSRGKSREDPHPEDSLLFRERWQAIIEGGDPYYNPNLTLENTFWTPALRGVDVDGLPPRVQPGPGQDTATGP